MRRRNEGNGVVAVDEPIGYEVLLMELKGTLEAYCRIYGADATKQAVKQAYTEVFKNE